MAELVATALVNAAISAAVSYVLAPDGPDIEGPRLDNRGVQRNSYGSPISRVYGTMLITGSLTWLLNNEITETKTTERQGGKGGGGGSKVTSYSYAWTGTNTVCEGEVNGIQRIWADTTLIYDQASLSDSAFGFAPSEYDFDFSLGSDDQRVSPDESGEKGVANTPAYRGTALHHVDDMELADYGNRIPNFQYEVAGLGSFDLEGETDLSIEKIGDLTKRIPVQDPETVSSASHALGVRPGVNTLFTGDAKYPNNTFFDYEGFYKNQTGIISAPKTVFYPQSNFGPLQPHVDFGYEVISAAYARNSSRYMLLRFGPSKDIYAWYDTALDSFIHSAVDPDDVYSSFLAGTSSQGARGRSIHLSTALAETKRNLWHVDWDGTNDSDIYVYAVPKTNTSAFHIARWNLTQLSGNTALVGDPYRVQLDGNPDQTHVVAWPRDTGITLPMKGVILTDDDVPNTIEDEAFISTNSGFIELKDNGATLESVHYNPHRNWVIGTSTSSLYLYDSITGDLIHEEPSFFSANQQRRFLVWWVSPNSFTDGYSIYQIVTDPTLDDGADSDPGADLQYILEQECLRCGIPTSDTDFTALGGTRVRGYEIKGVQSGRESIEALMPAYGFELYEEDYKIKARFKDRASILTVTEDDMRPHMVGSESGEFIEIEQIEESKLPIRVNVSYLNHTADYEPDLQFAERSKDSTSSRHVADVSLPMTFTPTVARQVADKLLREAWVSRTQYKFKLPKKYSYLIPTDVITLSTSDYTVNVRLQKVDMGVDGRLDIEAVQHDQAVFTSSVSTENPANTNSQFPKPQSSETEFFLIDTNQLKFSEGAPDGFFPVYLAGWSANFRGYQLQESTDGDFWDDVGVAQLNKAIIGFVQTPIGDVRSDFEGVFDPIDTLEVYFLDENPDVSSATELEVLAGQNIFAVGAEGRWEILGAKNVVSVDSHNYQLSGFLRGLQGSNLNTGTMQEGDAVILLDIRTIGQMGVSNDKIGTTRQYRAVTGSAIPDPELNKTLTLTGNPNKEWSAANIEGRRNASGDLIISWARRTRLSGEWRDNIDAFLASDSKPEEYKVLIYDGSTLLRTIEDITSSTVTYTDAQQTTDSAPDQVTVEIYQVSSLGDGYKGTALL